MYHQHHEHQATQQQPLQQQQQSNGYAPNATPVADGKASSAGALDHALLESLFYSEMMFDSTTLSAQSLPTEHDTPHTIVEKEILRDFGVGSGTSLFQDPAQSSPDSAPLPAPTDTPHYDSSHMNPQNGSSSYATGVLPPQVPPQQQHQQHQQQQQQQPIHQHQQPMHRPQGAPLHHQAPPPASAVPQYAHNGSTPNYAVPSGVTNASAVPQPTTSNPQHPQSVGMPVYMDTQATATAAAAAAAMLGNNGNIKVQSSQSLPALASPNTTRKAASLGGYSSSNPGLTSAASSNGIPQQPITSNKRPRVPEQRARQLVDQFATLASRLGIDLPNSVLQSLTSAAAKNDPTLLNDTSATGATSATAASANTTTTATSTTTSATLNSATAAVPNKASGASSELTAMAPTVVELRNIAEEAIAAVAQSNMNRSASTENLSRAASSQARPANPENKPTYSKRRKKPRLSDCEAKLAQLKAENEQLKRHLQNVSNKAHKFDKEKEEAGKQIARFMNDPNAGPREMETSVTKFSDMYSDYGVNRQQELSFHLEQLQRLVNPTNFTKMGLWTLGQTGQGSKKNPIAGILVKELDITPQQGRKILDQSEKIRKLCDNLKEAHALLVKLKHLCEKKTQTFQDRMNKCTQILTSKQVVKLICWINENAQLLESVCPGWGTEHIQSKK
eukprot:CAMPEP_0116154284 /NCGR_PEP_ID=MMETSP0329-20121206/21700_1 /TAXON_ID=697910 /ORGANISM="Pseudo-nitzschia arenysensis, Strain B593" /LENGTH=674 /DNA_ID=CAMNT_0003651257 /DNA_START=91 /DNA_END=2115 /DNA_ORIENTATION=+